MKEITEVTGQKEASIITNWINQHGFMPEHNFEYFKCLTDEGMPAFFYNDDFGVLCYLTNEGKKSVVRTLVEPMPIKKENSIACIKRLLDFCLNQKKVDKVVLETRFEIKEELKEHLKKSEFRVVKERYYLTWPVFIMKNFDETLNGGKWKKIRYFKNKMFKEAKVELTDYSPDYKEQVKQMILDWTKKRTATDRAAYQRYLNFVDNNFKGFDMVKIIKLNDKMISIFGGWKIVNSNNYYSCLGIYDYDVENIGEVSNILDLTAIKAMGFEKADFGGGEESLTNFKKKFFPDELYRTDLYAVELVK